jgi:hypothetical protein
MKKSIFISIVLFFLCLTIFGQENRISISAGYPYNRTIHWLVDKWEKPISFDIRFNRSKDFLLIGGGVNYSKYDVSWFRFYNSDKNTISNLTPYLQVGFDIERKFISLIPHLNLGYSALLTDIEIYNGDKGGFYSAVGLDFNFNLTEKIQLGLGANYGVIFSKVDFEYEGAITTEFVPCEHKRMKLVSLNLNFAYRF